jgi:Flp pilus assembly protein TadG
MLKFVRRLFRSESGNVLMIGAATLPMVMGAAGLAVDTVQLALWKRQLQRAADSAALAGAHAMVQGASTNQAIANDLDEHIDYDLDKNETAGTPVAEVDPGSYAAGIISDESCSTRGAANCWDRAVRVTLSFDRRLPFFSMFTKTLNRVEADSVAAVDGGGDFLHDRASQRQHSGHHCRRQPQAEHEVRDRHQFTRWRECNQHLRECQGDRLPAGIGWRDQAGKKHISGAGDAAFLKPGRRSLRIPSGPGGSQLLQFRDLGRATEHRACHHPVNQLLRETGRSKEM